MLFLAISVRAEQAPNFQLQDINGKPFVLNAHAGKEVVLIDFWATFCVPCLSALDGYRDLQNRYADKGLRIAAISVDQPQTLARVRSFARAKNFPYSVLLDPEQEAYRLYGVAVLPTTVLVDRDGKVVYRKEGFEPGDEKALEKRLSELLKASQDSVVTGVPEGAVEAGLKPAPTAPSGALNNLSLSGSNFMRVNYGKEDRSDPDNSGWLEDWFDLRLASDRLSYQARFRAYQFLSDLSGSRDNVIRNPNDRVVKQTFAYESDHADIRAGNYYGTINRGLVLRTFEDRQARIDRDVKGAWGSLKGGTASNGLGRGRISVFGGSTYSSFADLYAMDAEEDQLRNTHLQGTEGEWEPRSGTTLGAQYLEAFRTDWHAKIGAGNWEQLWGPMALYLAYAQLEGQDKFNYPNDYHGRGVYAALSGNFGPLEAGAEYKYYYNYNLAFTDPPSLVKYHTFRLMARDMLFPNNQAEEGVQLRGAWHFPGQTVYSANVSHIISHPERNPAFLIHHVELPYLDVDQSLQWSGQDQSHLILDMDWNRQRKFEEGSFQDINAFNLGATYSRPLRGPWNVQGEFELQKRFVKYDSLVPPDPVSGILGEVGVNYLKDNPWQSVVSATIGHGSEWTFTLDYEVTTSKVERDTGSIHDKLPGINNGWASAYLTCSALQGHQISLWLGQRKERVVCSGGSCRLEPAFEGAELIWISHF